MTERVLTAAERAEVWDALGGNGCDCQDCRDRRRVGVEALVRGRADAEAENRRLREVLAAWHGCDAAGLYRDDGEVSCGTFAPPIDFLRESPETLVLLMRRHHEQRGPTLEARLAGLRAALERAHNFIRTLGVVDATAEELAMMADSLARALSAEGGET